MKYIKTKVIIAFCLTWISVLSSLYIKYANPELTETEYELLIIKEHWYILIPLVICLLLIINIFTTLDKKDKIKK